MQAADVIQLSSPYARAYPGSQFVDREKAICLYVKVWVIVREGGHAGIGGLVGSQYERLRDALAGDTPKLHQ